jgi:hypothetical protein
VNREIRRQALWWEIAGILFIFLAGSALHFLFEWTLCWRPVAVIAPVNESIWEHLKLGFWPGLFFAAVESAFLRRKVNNFWVGKAVYLLTSPVIIVVGFYTYTAILGDNMVVLDISLFLISVVVGQLLSYRLLVAPQVRRWARASALVAMVALVLAFSLLSYFPPRIFVFEDSMTHEYGILEGCGHHE